MTTKRHQRRDLQTKIDQMVEAATYTEIQDFIHDDQDNPNTLIGKSYKHIKETDDELKEHLRVSLLSKAQEMELMPVTPVAPIFPRRSGRSVEPSLFIKEDINRFYRLMKAQSSSLFESVKKDEMMEQFRYYSPSSSDNGLMTERTENQETFGQKESQLDLKTIAALRSFGHTDCVTESQLETLKAQDFLLESKIDIFRKTKEVSDSRLVAIGGRAALTPQELIHGSGLSGLTESTSSDVSGSSDYFELFQLHSDITKRLIRKIRDQDDLYYSKEQFDADARAISYAIDQLEKYKDRYLDSVENHQLKKDLAESKTDLSYREADLLIETIGRTDLLNLDALNESPIQDTVLGLSLLEKLLAYKVIDPIQTSLEEESGFEVKYSPYLTEYQEKRLDSNTNGIILIAKDNGNFRFNLVTEEEAEELSRVEQIKMDDSKIDDDTILKAKLTLQQRIGKLKTWTYEPEMDIKGKEEIKTKKFLIFYDNYGNYTVKNLSRTNENKLVYVVRFDTPLNKNERKSFMTVKNITINQNREIETTDKKSYNEILDRADEIGLSYDNFVEQIKEDWDSKSGIFIDTQLWKRSNGNKQPRGKGFWWHIGSTDTEDNLWAAPFNLTYAQSKKEAIKKALEDGATTIILAP